MDLSFKEYLDSKRQLRAAIDQTPVSVKRYEVRKYCSIALGETKEDAKLIALKPKQKIVVEWRYDKLENPTVVHVKFIGVQTLNEGEEYQMFWTSSKFNKWLVRHAREANG